MAQTYLLKNIDHVRFLKALGPTPGTDAEALEAYAALMRAAGAVLEEGDAQLARHGLSQGRLRLLAQLKIDGEAQPAVIAERIGVSRATITGLLDRLEKDGMVERKPSASDKRSLIVRLAPKGRKLVDKLLPERARRVSRLLETLSKADKRRLVELLGKIEAGVPRYRTTDPSPYPLPSGEGKTAERKAP